MTIISLLAFLTFLLSHGVQGEFKDGYYYEGSKKIGRKEDFFNFRTRPDLLAPRWNITIHDEKALAPGYYAVAPYKKLSITKRGEAWIGPHIYDQQGELVWSGAGLFDHYKAFDIRLANVSGVEMMTAMYPHENSAAIINHHYEIVEKVVHSSAWEYSNMHDFNVVEDGTRALVLTKDGETYLSREKSAAVGFDGECQVRGDGLKYLDITTLPPKILMSWNSTNHIDLDETVMQENHDPIDVLCSDADKWDLHHLNSIDIMPDGDFLVSSRATSTLYKISHETGEIVWRIGGKKSNFDLPEVARFNFQHHARVHDHNETHFVLSLMDNSKDQSDDDIFTPRPYSAGLLLSLDTVSMTGQLIGEFPHPYMGRIHKRGSAHLQPNGNMLMGWADNILLSEHAPDGRKLMEANILPKLDSYRSYKFSWVGEPLDPPDVYSAAFVSGNTTYTMASVSWNGATEVKKWKLYEVDVENGSEKLLTKTKKTGFETDLTIEGYAQYVVAEAINKHAKVIGRSRPVWTIPSADEDATLPAQNVVSGDAVHSSIDPHPEASSSAVAWISVASSAPSPSAFTTQPAPSQPTAAYLDLLVDEKEHHSSQTTEQVATEETTWADTIRENHILAAASGLGGFVACAALIAVIWALRRFRVKPWWSPGAVKYAPLHDDQQDAEDDVEMEERGGK